MRGQLRCEANRLRRALYLPKPAASFRACERLLVRYFAVAASHAGEAGLPGQPITSPAHVRVKVRADDGERARQLKRHISNDLDDRRTAVNAWLLPHYTFRLQVVAMPDDLRYVERELSAIAAMAPNPDDLDCPPPNPDSEEALHRLRERYPRWRSLARIMADVRVEASVAHVFQPTKEEDELEDQIERFIESKN